MKSDSIYIQHIIEQIERISNSIIKKTKKHFIRDVDMQDAILRRLEVIGEATKNISQDTKNSHPKIEWRKISGTRDVLIHAYFSVDLDLVWKIIKQDIQTYNKQLLKILKDTK